MLFVFLTFGFSVPIKRISTRFSTKQSNDGSLCDLCHQFVTYVKDFIQSASLEEEIKEFLDGYCDTLSWPTRDICKNLVSSYLPTIIQMAEDEIDTLQICQKIGLCNETSKFTKKVAHIKPKNDDTASCALCQQLVHVVNFLLANETLEEEIEEMALSYCDSYGWPTKDICRNTIQTYLPSFITYCKDNIDPFKICERVGFCDSVTTLSPRRYYYRKSDQGCQTCQNWFKWAEDKLDEVTVEGLWKLISEECPRVPYLNYFCQIINEQNIETFVSLILSAIPPEQCCQWIKVC